MTKNPFYNSLFAIAYTAALVIGLYLGVRYVGAVLHYACAVPEEDCPPPFYWVGEFGFYLTGGTLVPLWVQD